MCYLLGLRRRGIYFTLVSALKVLKWATPNRWNVKFVLYVLYLFYFSHRKHNKANLQIVGIISLSFFLFYFFYFFSLYVKMKRKRFHGTGNSYRSPDIYKFSFSLHLKMCFCVVIVTNKVAFSIIFQNMPFESFIYIFLSYNLFKLHQHLHVVNKYVFRSSHQTFIPQSIILNFIPQKCSL